MWTSPTSSTAPRLQTSASCPQPATRTTELIDKKPHGAEGHGAEANKAHVYS
jgi:hypothetical protein